MSHLHLLARHIPRVPTCDMIRTESIPHAFLDWENRPEQYMHAAS